MFVSLVYETDDYNIQAIGDTFNAMGVKIVVQGSHFTTTDNDQAVTVGTSPVIYSVRNGDLRNGALLEASGENFLAGIFNLEAELRKRAADPITRFAVAAASPPGEYDLYKAGSKSGIHKDGALVTAEKPLEETVIQTQVPRGMMPDWPPRAP
jgi:hypothetical protein